MKEIGSIELLKAKLAKKDTELKEKEAVIEVLKHKTKPRSLGLHRRRFQ